MSLRRLVAIVLANAPLVAWACTAFEAAPASGGTDVDAGRVDGPDLDANIGAPACDPTAPFDPPTPVLGVNSPFEETGGRLSADELTIYFASQRPGGAGSSDLWIAARTRRDAPFEAPAPLAMINTPGFDSMPAVTGDGLTLYFFRTPTADAAATDLDLFVSTRASVAVPFVTAAPVSGVNSPTADYDPSVVLDGRALYFASTRSGGGDLFRAEKSGAGFSGPVPIVELNSPLEEDAPAISIDELTLYFARVTTDRKLDIFVARRAARLDPFGPPQPVSELDTAADEVPSWISPDGCRLYILTNRPGGFGDRDIWVASRTKR